MIALELFPALMLADFPRYQWIVLVSVLGSSFGPQKKVWHKLKPGELGRLANVDPSNIRAAMRALTERKVLIKNNEGLYRFNKAFNAWNPGLNPTAQRFVDHALGLWTDWPSDKHTLQSRETRNGFNETRCIDTRNGFNETRNGFIQTGVSKPAQPPTPPNPPIEDSRASEDLGFKKDKENPPNPPKGGGAGVIPFSRRDRTRQTSADRRRAKVEETLSQLQAEHDAMSPEELEAERQLEIEAVRRRFGQAGVDRYLADEARDREKAQRLKGATHGGR
jgi:hypothetical protein